MADELYALMRCAPSTRRFTDEPVAPEVIERVLDNARFAPSGGNRQGWRVIVVTDPQLRTGLRELYAEPWRAYTERMGTRPLLEGTADPSDVAPRRLRSLRAADEYARTFDRVPVHLVICVVLDALAIVDSELDRPSIVGGASIYPFVQNITLGLRAEGLGASFTTMLTAVEDDVRSLLEIPEGIAVAGHMSVGHRADPWPSKLRRNPVSEFAFRDRWGDAL